MNVAITVLVVFTVAVVAVGIRSIRIAAVIWTVTGFLTAIGSGAYIVGVPVGILLFLLPGLAMWWRLPIGWWIAVVAASLLGVLAPLALFVHGVLWACSVAEFVIAIICFVIYAPCLVMLLANRPSTWNKAAPVVETTGADV